MIMMMTMMIFINNDAKNKILDNFITLNFMLIDEDDHEYDVGDDTQVMIIMPRKSLKTV